jgi:PAS domain S-box-containing protein
VRERAAASRARLPRWHEGASESAGDGAGDVEDFFEHLLRRFVLVVAVLAGAAALLYGLVLIPAQHPSRWMIVGSCLGLAALALALARRRFGLSHAASVMVLAFAVLAVVAGIAVGMRLGLYAAALGFMPLLVCMVAVLVGLRGALWLAGATLVVLGALAGAETGGLLVVNVSHAPPAALILRLSTHTMLLLTALAIGAFTSRAIRQARLRALEREQHFAGLLAVAADWYWEMDASFRYTHVSDQSEGGPRLQAERLLGRTPWEIEGFGLDAQAMDAHRADLESHQPFSDLPLQRSDRQGQRYWYAVSGQPRFDGRGKFLGYWGVGRDITAEKRSEGARVATEARYRELFARSPSPLVLHRDANVLDANNAALALFGMPDAGTLIGRSLLDFYDEADGSRHLATERARALRELPVGEAMPARQFVLRAARGRRIVAQVSSVKVDTGGGPAILSIYHDDTERLRAESARVRSEALMTHLVATSPDLISLSDLATGRYVMVNDAFTRVSGWSREEVVGRTAAEIGVWPNAEARTRFVDEVSQSGEVRDRGVDFVDRQGRAVSLMVSAARFTLEGRDYLVVNGRDVSAVERERLEREAILLNASIGIAMTRERRFQLANPKFEQMFGWEPGALVGQPGSVVWASEADYEALGRELGPSLARGDPIDIERRMTRRDGSTFLCRLLARAVDPTHPSKGATIWIAEDVTERRAVEQALAQARDAAEAASRAKSAFLANTSHEIRTPLNGLVGLARLARQPGVDPARRERYLQQIDDSAQSLSGVISDILDLSKIEAGKLRLEAIDFDLHALLESIEHGYAALAEARGLTLEMAVYPGVPRRVRGDPARLRQVLSNFLSNALKFTEQGSVRVEVRPLAGSRLHFEVQDAGPGIDTAVQAKLFAPFTQADVSTTRRFGGTGLGLSICRELAELMGGAVGVISAPGQGSRFWAELPLPASTESGPESSFAGLPDQPGPLASLRVLVAEDNPVNMLIVAAFLEQWGVKATQVGNGAQAVASVNAQADAGTPFDLVLMDVQMPVMGGYDATRAIRQRHRAADLPIIALTAAALTSERDEALACGMNDFLTKPIDAQRLHDALLHCQRARSGAS